MKRIPIIKIQAIRDGSLNYHTKRVRCPEDAEGIFRDFHDKNCQTDRESFMILCLNTKNIVVAINVVSVGTLNSATVHPREVYKAALLANAAAIILGHNHPSGDPSPSQEDVEITKRLQEAGEMIGIPVLDHLVIGEPRHVSMKTIGLI